MERHWRKLDHISPNQSFVCNGLIPLQMWTFSSLVALPALPVESSSERRSITILLSCHFENFVDKAACPGAKQANIRFENTPGQQLLHCDGHDSFPTHSTAVGRCTEKGSRPSWLAALCRRA